MILSVRFAQIDKLFSFSQIFLLKYKLFRSGCLIEVCNPVKNLFVWLLSAQSLRFYTKGAKSLTSDILDCSSIMFLY